MGISRYKVQGTRKLQATGDPSSKLALIAFPTQISRGSLPILRLLGAYLLAEQSQRDEKSVKGSKKLRSVVFSFFVSLHDVSDIRFVFFGSMEPTRMANEGDLSGALAASLGI